MDFSEYEQRYQMIEKGIESGAISWKAGLAKVSMLALDYANSGYRRTLDDGTKLPQIQGPWHESSERAKVRAAYLDHTRGVIERSEARREQAAREKIERDPLG